MKMSSPRNALAFLGDKLQVNDPRQTRLIADLTSGKAFGSQRCQTCLQARRDASFLEEYRKQEHASLQKEVFYNIEDDAEILAKQQKITSVIKYDNQSPGGKSSFSTSAQVCFWSTVPHHSFTDTLCAAQA